MGDTVSERAATALLAMTLVAASQPAGPASHPLTAEEGQRLAVKLARIVDHDTSGSRTGQTVVLPDREINAYLRFQGASLLPTGVTESRLMLAGNGGIAARAIVDLDAVARSRKRGFLDPLSYLGGNLEVTASGVLQTADGLGQVVIDSVTVGGISVPTTVLGELVRYYSRSDAHSNGVDLAEPFELPYRIREVMVGIDEAVVVQ